MRLLSYFILTFFISELALSQDIQTIDVYSEGVNLVEEGNLEAALELWENHYNSENIVQGSMDPKVGFKYIELVTGKRLYNKYKLASEMYFLAFNATLNEENKSVYKEEFIRLNPLLEKTSYSNLADDLDSGEFRKRIVPFWNQFDPTPTTSYNERLLEHWERINFILKEYGEWNTFSDILEYDARAPLYLKLGVPKRKKSGILFLDDAQLTGLIRIKINDLPNRYDRNSLDNAVAQEVIRNLEIRTKQLHQDPYYEVWLYENTKSRISNKSIYFFESSNGRRYSQKQSIDDFIPPSAYSMGSRNRTFSLYDASQAANSNVSGAGSSGIGVSTTQQSNENNTDLSGNVTPAVLLQHIYYQQLSAFDAYFGMRYSDMYSNYIDNSTQMSTSMAIINKQTSTAEFARLRSEMPSQLSNYENVVSPIDLIIFPYRFIKDGKNLTAFIVESDAFEPFSIDYTINQLNDKSPSYNYEHSVSVFNQDWNKKYAAIDNPKLEIDGNIKKAFAQSVFIVPNEDYKDNLVFTAKLENRSDSSFVSNSSSPFENTYKGFSRSELKHPNSLKTNGFEVSDVMLGTDIDLNDQYDFPIKINNQREIPEGEFLVLYYEVYGINQDTTDNQELYSFDIEFRIKPTDQRRRLFRKTNYTTSLGLTMRTNESVQAEPIQIDTSNYEVGEYSLEIVFKNSISGERILRELNFSVVP